MRKGYTIVRTCSFNVNFPSVCINLQLFNTPFDDCWIERIKLLNIASIRRLVLFSLGNTNVNVAKGRQKMELFKFLNYGRVKMLTKIQYLTSLYLFAWGLLFPNNTFLPQNIVLEKMSLTHNKRK